MLRIFEDERRRLGPFSSNPMGTDQGFPLDSVADGLCGTCHTAPSASCQRKTLVRRDRALIVHRP
jgi:hypothetical protein